MLVLSFHRWSKILKSHKGDVVFKKKADWRDPSNTSASCIQPECKWPTIIHFQSVPNDSNERRRSSIAIDYSHCLFVKLAETIFLNRWWSCPIRELTDEVYEVGKGLRTKQSALISSCVGKERVSRATMCCWWPDPSMLNQSTESGNAEQSGHLLHLNINTSL